MAIGATIGAVQQGGVVNITVTQAGRTLYQCQYPAALPPGLTLAQYKAMIVAEVTAMVQQIIAGQGAGAPVAGLDGTAI